MIVVASMAGMPLVPTMCFGPFMRHVIVPMHRLSVHTETPFIPVRQDMRRSVRILFYVVNGSGRCRLSWFVEHILTDVSVNQGKSLYY
jgi:hypothetical protein